MDLLNVTSDADNDEDSWIFNLDADFICIHIKSSYMIIKLLMRVQC